MRVAWWWLLLWLNVNSWLLHKLLLIVLLLIVLWLLLHVDDRLLVSVNNLSLQDNLSVAKLFSSKLIVQRVNADKSIKIDPRDKKGKENASPSYGEYLKE